MRSDDRRAFTLIELLIVIAIVAILATVVIFVLNPGELLKQSRDTNRVSDLHTLQSALNIYVTDVAGGGQTMSLGNASSVYLSLPDTSSTCGSYSLPALPGGYSYHCAGPDTYRDANGTGWIPINFASTSFGAPISNLPVDPTNSTSSCTYYAFVTNGTTFALSGGVESQKERSSLAAASGTYPDLLEFGSNPALIPVDFASACSSSTSTSGGGGQSNLAASSTLSNSVQSYTFTGHSGESVNIAFLNITRTGSCPTFTLTSPSSTTIANQGICGNTSWNNLILPGNGTYTLSMNPGTGTSNANIWISDTVSLGTMSFETPFTASNTVYGQYAKFTFTGTAGEQSNFVFTGIQRTDNCPTFQLVSPSGTQLGIQGICGNTSWNNMTLPNTGTYVFNINPGDSLVTSTVLWNDSKPSANLPINSQTTIANSYAGQYMNFTFTGSSGESVNFVFTGIQRTDNCPTFQLMNPSNSQVAIQGICGDTSWNNVNLSTAGTYTLNVNPGDSLVTSTIGLNDSASLGTISVNTNTAFNNSYPGQYISMTFSGTAGQVVKFSGSGITRSNGTCPTFYLINPSGGTVESTGVCGSSFAFGSTTLPTTGTYTVSVNPGLDLVTSTLYLAE